ncbi:hypothetical protein UCRPC4_g03830 [Phaeomoniella chlamydospora]|uniref:Uncharacterized protein n=1 Tax=Phaeomoniella chlamydospora TaxID=158046 RepID=A0A0G2EFA3_PHACM|nr:hypothetical protein UCRPC4_g03830 [Phaeomoniella chlamydospora]
MARNRTGNRSGTSATTATNGTRATLMDQASDELEDSGPPTIKFFPHQELPAGRPSLHFSPIARTLPSTSSIIKVGRYSEREGIPIANPTTPSDAPVGFKSKVVSRKHCEFSFQHGSWYIKDVASSSGTFLNHVRLSQPNQVSRLFPVKDGDVVQLGIDFRGGEEMIFRCVKIRIECNRSWQQRPNKFNQERHAQLVRKKPDVAGTAGATVTENSGECSICLSSVMSLFVAPCAHVWHFKCIYPLIIGKRYPHFTCPNCRAVWNLEEEVDNEEYDGDREGLSQLIDGQAAGDELQNATVLATDTTAARDAQLVGAGAGALDADNDTSMITGNLSMDESNSNDEAAPGPPQRSSSESDKEHMEELQNEVQRAARINRQQSSPVRNLVRTITTTSYVKGSKPSEAELADIERTVRILIAIPYTVKNHLRAEWGAAFAKNTSDISNSAEVANPKYNPEYADLLPPAMEGHEDQGLGLPLQLTFFVDGFVKRAFDRGWYGAPQASQLQVQLNTLTDAYGKMEMIRMTPFPVAHLIHARQVLALYGAVLPFAMVDELGWWTVPIVTLIIFTLYGIEGIGSQLEDPFGYDRNDIKMDAIAEDARIEMTVTLEEWKRVSRSSDLSSEMFIEPRRASLR